ncbi:MAG: archease [Desulfatibacillaceae bacterium]
MQETYETLDHTADLGIRVFGQNRAKLFENSAWALTHLLTDPTRIFGKHRRELRIQGEDAVDLWVNWLRELLALYTVEGRFVHGCRVFRVSETEVYAKVALDDFDPEKHEIRTELKAVTYHEARFEQTDKGFEAQVIFDT